MFAEDFAGRMDLQELGELGEVEGLGCGYAIITLHFIRLKTL